MIYYNTIYIGKRSCFFYLKHYCPNCQNQLKVIEVSKNVDPYSEDAKKFKPYFAGDESIGNIMFVWKELKCLSCNKQYTEGEIFKNKNKAQK